MYSYYETWHTDLMNIDRPVQISIGNIQRTSTTCTRIASNVSCHIYQTSKSPLNITGTSSEIQESNALCCSTDVDIKAGDLLTITRYKTGKVEEYLAGEPADKMEPFGNAIPHLQHKEVPIQLKKRV